MQTDLKTKLKPLLSGFFLFDLGPSCSDLVSERIVNEHLEDCLARGEDLEKETHAMGGDGGGGGDRASKTSQSREGARTGDSEHRRGNFEGQNDNSHLSAEVARQFRRDFSALQRELEGIKDGFSRFESRMRKLSVAVAAHLGEAALLDTNNNDGESDSENIREELQVGLLVSPLLWR